MDRQKERERERKRECSILMYKFCHTLFQQLLLSYNSTKGQKTAKIKMNIQMKQKWNSRNVLEKIS